MRSKLLTAVLVAVGFWWLLLWGAWAVFSRPSDNLREAAWMRPVWDFFGFQVPAEAGILDGIVVQNAILLTWSGGVLLLAGLAFGLGFLSAWKRHHRAFEGAESRKKGWGEVRGVKATMGPCPDFPACAREEIEFASDAADGLPAEQKALLSAVFSVLMAHPDARHDGEGSLAAYASAIALRELQDGGRRPGLSAIAASAVMLGNITSFTREEDGWAQTKKDVPRQGELILVSLPEWWQLPEPDRTALAWAVGYWDHPEDMPIAPEATAKLAASILKDARTADREVSAQNALDAVTKTNQERDLVEIFLAKLPTLPFHNGLPRGVPAVGWRKGSRVYLIENQLIDKYLIQDIPQERRKSLLDVPRKSRVSNLTREMLRLFKERGWLVTEEAGHSLAWDSALWQLKAGKVLYRRIIALDFSGSPEIMEMLPSDSIYPLSVEGPQFADSVTFDAGAIGGIIKTPVQKTRPIP